MMATTCKALELLCCNRAVSGSKLKELQATTTAIIISQTKFNLKNWKNMIAGILRIQKRVGYWQLSGPIFQNKKYLELNYYKNCHYKYETLYNKI